MAACLLLLTAAAAHAQVTPDSGPFSGNRRFYSPTPFEIMDQSRGSVSLNFIDLVLPAGGGIELRFARLIDGGTGEWKLGLAGIPTSAVSYVCNTSSAAFNPMQFPPTDFLEGPELSGLGFRQRAYFLVPPTPSDCDTQRWFETTDRALYDSVENKLWFPNGLRCSYVSGALQECSLRRASGWQEVLTVTETPDSACGPWKLAQHKYEQHVQSGTPVQKRTVYIDYAYNGGCQLTSVTMSYDGREWVYEITPGGILGALTKATLPEGLEWHFAYVGSGGGSLLSVTTPAGGDVTYTYGVDIWNGQNHGAHLLSRSQRDLAGDTSVRTWTINRTYITECNFEAEPNAWCVYHWEIPRTTQIVTPGGAVYGGVACDPPSWGQVGDWLVGGIDVCEGYSSARHDTTVLWEPEIFKTYASGIRLVRFRSRGSTIENESSIDQSVSEHTTYIDQYDDCGNATQTTASSSERSGVTRVVDRTYLNTPSSCAFSGPPDPSTFIYRLGQPTSESVTTSDGTVVTHRADYDDTTGFMEWDETTGVRTTYTPTTDGLVATATSATNVVTTFTYDWGVANVVQTGSSQNTVAVTRSINADGSVASETRDGLTTTFTYDDLGRLKTTQGPGGSSLSAPTVVTYNDSLTTGPTVKTQRGNAWMRTRSDAFGMPLDTEDSTDSRTRTDYDADRRVIGVKHPYFGSTPAGGVIFEYDARSRLKKETHSDQAYREYSYHRDMVAIRDENGHVTTTRYEMLGVPSTDRLLELIDAASQQWTYTYDAAGQLKTMTGPPAGSATVPPGPAVVRTWTYHTDQTLTGFPSGSTPAFIRHEIHPESGTVEYTDYFLDGAVARLEDAKGTAFEYEYDSHGRLWRTTVTPTSGPEEETEITYKAGTDLVESTDGPDVTTEWAYQSTTGRLASRTDTVDGRTFKTEFEYDDRDNLTKVTYPSGRQVGYAYDDHNRLTRVFDAVTPQQTYADEFEYDASGAMTSYTAGNGIPTTLSYDEHRQWLNSLTVGTGAPLLQLTFGHDYVGNVKEIDDGRGPAWTQLFDYDPLDRLESAGPGGVYPSVTYTYDPHGNRQTAGSLTYTYESSNPFRLRQISGDSLVMTYDANGNLENGPASTYTYTTSNQMRTASVNGVQTHYAYDPDNWRIKKVTSGQATTYTIRGAGSELLSEWSNASPTATVRDYIYAAGRLITIITTHRPYKQAQP